MASFNDNELVGRVRLGLPDDYADRYLPEILARFSRSNPKAEVTVMCEPTQNLIERVQHGDIDLAIITHVDRRGPSEIVRIEQLLWVTSARHAVHEERPFPWRSAGPIVTGAIPRQKHWRAPTGRSGSSTSRGIRQRSAPPSWPGLRSRFCRKAQCARACAFWAPRTAFLPCPRARSG